MHTNAKLAGELATICFVKGVCNVMKDIATLDSNLVDIVIVGHQIINSSVLECQQGKDTHNSNIKNVMTVFKSPVLASA